jgi:hypothetical protein
MNPEQRNAALATILADLDRCQHGRHRGDTCYGYDPRKPQSGCPGGVSLGNPFLVSGAPIGYDLSGWVYVVPAKGRSCSDPTAWVTGSDQMPEGISTDDEE